MTEKELKESLMIEVPFAKSDKDRIVTMNKTLYYDIRRQINKHNQRVEDARVMTGVPSAISNDFAFSTNVDTEINTYMCLAFGVTEIEEPDSKDTLIEDLVNSSD